MLMPPFYRRACAGTCAKRYAYDEAYGMGFADNFVAASAQGRLQLELQNSFLDRRALPSSASSSLPPVDVFLDT